MPREEYENITTRDRRGNDTPAIVLEASADREQEHLHRIEVPQPAVEASNAAAEPRKIETHTHAEIETTQNLGDVAIGNETLEVDEMPELNAWIPPQVMQSMAPNISQRFAHRDGVIPRRVDLRDYLPRPGNQKENNDCVAWAIAYAAYSCQICQERRRKHPTLKSDIFSPQFIYDKLGAGNKPLYALQVIQHVKQNGCATQATMESQASNDEIIEAKNFKLKRNERARTLRDMKSYLHEGYPIILIVRMGKFFRNNQVGEKPYRWSEDEPMGAKPSFHAVTAVGYDDTREAVLLMNSWGTEWKKDGFCWVSYDNFSEISDSSWCGEAHVAGVKRIAPYNVWFKSAGSDDSLDVDNDWDDDWDDDWGDDWGDVDDRRDFQLQADRKVYEHGEPITPLKWQIDDATCTIDTLFVLNRDQTIYRLNGGGEKRSWSHLNNGLMAGKDVTMLAADHTSALHALTSDHQLLQYHTNSGRWSLVALPSDASEIVDLRMVDNRVHATNIHGSVYVRNDQDRWELAR